MYSVYLLSSRYEYEINKLIEERSFGGVIYWENNDIKNNSLGIKKRNSLQRDKVMKAKQRSFELQIKIGFEKRWQI